MKLYPPAVIHELEIPEDVRPTRLWSEQMLELAAHIGPYHTLILIDRVGGQRITIPMTPERNRLRDVIGPEKAAILSRVYGGEKIAVPVGNAALSEARRGPVLAAIRAGKLTIAEAVPILRKSERWISQLINHSDEGTRERAWVPPKIRARRRDVNQLDMFETETP